MGFHEYLCPDEPTGHHAAWRRVVLGLSPSDRAWALRLFAQGGRPASPADLLLVNRLRGELAREARRWEPSAVGDEPAPAPLALRTHGAMESASGLS